MSQQSFNAKDWFNARVALRDDFLRQHGLVNVPLSPVGEDSSSRRYFRLKQNDGSSMILMESVPDGEKLADGTVIATPGHSLKDFVRISQYLRSISVAAPEIYQADESKGFLLLEDFGDLTFKQAVEKDPSLRDTLYEQATDILIWLRKNASADAIALPEYSKSHVHIGRRRLIDWFVPAVRGQINPDGLAEDFLVVMDGIENSLPPMPMGIAVGDFHFENIMYPRGVLDFQGAMKGPVVYDLTNLLGDARLRVPADLRERMLDRYCQDMTSDERRITRDWFHVLSAQFHCRLMGQFIRLAVRDGKERYLPMIPLVAEYLRDELKEPVLKPLADWFAAQNIDFAKVDGFDANVIRPHIRPDAF